MSTEKPMNTLPELISGCLDDWFVIEPCEGSGQPEGSSSEWRQILAAMKSRKRDSFKRVGVEFDAEGNAWFWSPRNSMDRRAANVPAPEVDAWIARAEKIVPPPPPTDRTPQPPLGATPEPSATPRTPFLTVTGADERSDVTALTKINAEIGLLYTATPEGRNRYPRWEWIREISLSVRRASLHVCGRRARELLTRGELPVEGFQRIQVNGSILAIEVERLCAMYPRHTIITQHNSTNVHLLAVRAENHALLIDASGGQGRSPESWSGLQTTKSVGFAGGLGPDNLVGELRKIASVARDEWWVDMEGKLRVDDWFSVERAEQCAAIFAQHSELATARAALAQCEEKLAKAGVLETIIREIKAHDLEHLDHGVGCSCHDNHAGKLRSLFEQAGLYDIKESGFRASTKSLSNLMTVVGYVQRNP